MMDITSNGWDSDIVEGNLRVSKEAHLQRGTKFQCREFVRILGHGVISSRPPPPLGETLTRKRSKTFNAPKPVENVNENSQSGKSHVKGCPCFT